MDLSVISNLLNVKYVTLLNSMLILGDGHQFGSGSETVSFVLGKNLLSNTLSPLGHLIVELLNMFDANHVIKALGAKKDVNENPNKKQ